MILELYSFAIVFLSYGRVIQFGAVVLARYSCLLFSHLLVTDTCMYVLRDIPKQNDRAMVLSRRPLKNIVKITSKKKLPELITFKYGSYEEDGLVVTDTERFIIEKAGRLLSHYYMSIVVTCLSLSCLLLLLAICCYVLSLSHVPHCHMSIVVTCLSMSCILLSHVYSCHVFCCSMPFVVTCLSLSHVSYYNMFIVT